MIEGRIYQGESKAETAPRRSQTPAEVSDSDQEQPSFA